jgi:hypothetical protein
VIGDAVDGIAVVLVAADLVAVVHMLELVEVDLPKVVPRLADFVMLALSKKVYSSYSVSLLSPLLFDEVVVIRMKCVERRFDRVERGRAVKTKNSKPLILIERSSAFKVKWKGYQSLSPQ